MLLADVSSALQHSISLAHTHSQDAVFAPCTFQITSSKCLTHQRCKHASEGAVEQQQHARVSTGPFTVTSAVALTEEARILR